MSKRLGIGETSQAGERRKNFSIRESKGNINILNTKKSRGNLKISSCPVCHHHKFIGKPEGIFCSKCGHKIILDN